MLVQILVHKVHSLKRLTCGQMNHWYLQLSSGLSYQQISQHVKGVSVRLHRDDTLI